MSSTTQINASLLHSDDVEVGSRTTNATMSLAWRNIEAFVAKPGKKPSAASEKQVLFDASGEANPGELLAVMGPSGAGKTTLLIILAGRPALGDHGRWTGTITLNGRPLPPAWRRDAAYSMQKDIFFEKLTVYDHLACTAALRLPSAWTRAEKASEMQRIVTLLRLDGCLHTIVGSDTVRGLSGGELKRVNTRLDVIGVHVQDGHTCRLANVRRVACRARLLGACSEAYLVVEHHVDRAACGVVLETGELCGTGGGRRWA